MMTIIPEKESIMVNKSKAIGTKAESAVVKVLQPYFPDAERLALAGQEDQGDIGHCGDFVFEIKSGKAAETAGDGLLSKWVQETERERQARGVAFGILVLKRAGVGPANAHRWWAYVLDRDFVEWAGGYYRSRSGMVTVRLELGQLLDMIADLGYTADDPEVLVAS